jgi:hypothetical protein
VIRGTPKRSGGTWAAILIALQSFAAAAPAAEAVRSVDIVESSAFLEGYRAASEAQSAEFYDLYSDRAVIHARVQDQGQGIAFQGRAFKAWGRQLLKEGRAALDGSIFRDATVEQRGIRLLIRAKRYSTTRCYWDPTYQLGIEREGPSYRIVDERLTTNPTAHCVPEHAVVNASESMTLPPREFSLSPAISSVRPFDPQSTASWHPLSQQELADKAMQLAQQMAAARASLSRANGASSPSLIGAAPLRSVSLDRGPSTASVGREDAPSDLRVTPQE